MFNYVEKQALNGMIDVLMDVVKDRSKSNVFIVNLKFALSIVIFFFLFLLLWQKMVNSMKMNIVNALWLLNILPTSHLATNIEFIKEIQVSSLAT